ncbi:MAG: hypothetical protein KBG48_03730 [Kofleriaceae bacterium]|nr:hypothetical protein [Kofleriaceae bacterium]MBP9166466.1 hypothetical protein [Kofleriaceae bacterium]MBP9860303.1 hypothetical protein [Kofleriaceae bacterium]
MSLAQILLDARPFADPVARLDPDALPPPDVASIHAPARLAIAEAIAVVARERRSQMVLITGDPGMGKTHQLAHLRRRADGQYVCVDVPPLKDLAAPFAHIARYAVQGLAAAGALERLLWDTLRQVAVAVRADAAAHDDDDVVERIDQALIGGEQFAMAFRNLAQQDAGLGALLYKRGRRLLPLSTLPADFGKVLCRITDRDAERAIVDWLRAAELADEDLAALDLRTGVADEARAFEVLRALCVCSTRPLVLCLDQIESIAGLVGADGVARMFTALMELYQQAPIAIVLMCQTQQWIDLRKDVPLAALDRIRVLPPLAKPTAAEAEAILAARLAPVWTGAGARPPYPTWPLPSAYIRAVVDARRPTIRGLLLEADAALAEMRRTGVVVEPTVEPSVEPGAASAPSTPRPRAETVAPPDALRAARDKYRRGASERRELGTPAFREELVREAVLGLLGGAKAHGQAIAGAEIAVVDLPDKPRHGPRPPAVVTVQTKAGPRRIAVDVNSAPAQATVRVLTRLRDTVEEGRADCAVLLRERAAPLPESAKKSHELLAELSATGGAVVWLEEDDALRLVGAELLLDAAGAAEVLIGERQASRDEVLRYLLHDDRLGEVLAPVIGRATTTPPRPARRSAS